ncbi:MAG: hypothetical protein FJ096_03385 [Deltaproteobacteria bacterium]|nr:hypothetical protein [Deltaproteobacteria bacterium]
MSIEVEISNHPRRTSLAAVLRTLALTAADERRIRLGDGLDELLAEHRLEANDGRAGDVDVLALFRTLADERANPTVVERAALSRLFAHGVADLVAGEFLADQPERIDELARNLCWLAANTFLDALPELDRVLGGEHVDGVWQAIARRARSIDPDASSGHRPEAIVAVTALGGSASPAASAALRALSVELIDPALRTLAGQLVREQRRLVRLRPRGGPDQKESEAASPRKVTDTDAEDDDELEAPRLSFSARRAGVSGQQAPLPLGAFGIVLGAVTGYLLVRYLVRVGASALLGARRPAELRVDGTGITVSTRLELLGRPVRTREVVIPFTNLATARRELRFPRLGLYAGLVALAAGTLLGVSLVTDGVWGRSPSLVALGFGVFGVGVALDMTLTSLGLARGGRYTLVFVPRRGSPIALAVNDVHAADDALRAIADRSA